jgi:hypothetical protein
MTPDDRLNAIQARAHAMLRESDPQLAADLEFRDRAVLDLGITLGATAALEQVAGEAEEIVSTRVNWDDMPLPQWAREANGEAS